MKVPLILVGLLIGGVENNNQTQKQRDIETLIQHILDLPRLQWIFHPEDSSRIPVKVMAGGPVTKDLKLIKFHKPALILTLTELEEKKVLDYVKFKELKINGDTATFHLTYDIEGAFAHGILTWTKEKWTIKEYRVGER